jgi:hypothetical protein
LSFAASCYLAGSREINRAEKHHRTETGVISALHIWRAAHLLIRQHDAGAELEAARLQGLMLGRGDDEGRQVWRRIRRAIEALQAPGKGKPN